MEIVFLLIGLFAGAIAAYFYALSKVSAAKKEADKLLSDMQSKSASFEALLKDKERSVLTVQSELEEKRNELIKVLEANSGLKVAYAELNKRLDESKAEYENIQQRMLKEFELLSNKILDEKTAKFTEQNKTNIDIILNPLRENIKAFEERITNAYSVEAQERNTLKGEIKSLVDLNRQISEEAGNLVKALKGDVKKQGNWGEMILERILERSGLQKGSEYEVQVSTTNEEGQRFQPDVIIYLPDNKHVIIDSKVSLVAYEAMINCDDDLKRESCLKDHITSVKNHIRILSEKNYQATASLNSPDFVLLFMPIESSFGFAVQADTELFNFAWDRKIVIVSPSTLLATLRTIASIWKHERQTRNAIEIATQAGSLYDKFSGFYADLIDVGTKIDAAKRCHDDAVKKLATGPGNVIKKISDLKKMGAKATKQLPSAVVEAAEEEEE